VADVTVSALCSDILSASSAIGAVKGKRVALSNVLYRDEYIAGFVENIEIRNKTARVSMGDSIFRIPHSCYSDFIPSCIISGGFSRNSLIITSSKS
jgi:hypothetical protein